MDEYIGTIMLWAGISCPQNMMFCAGQSLPVSQYQALYSLIGNTYGGNSTSFNLPDLRSRVPVGNTSMGHQPAYTALTVVLGQGGGHAETTLTALNLPAHNHPLNAINQNADKSNPGSGVMLATPGAMAGRSFTASLGYSDQTSSMVRLSNDSIGFNQGGNMPIDNTQPYLGLNYIICVNGMYPNPQ